MTYKRKTPEELDEWIGMLTNDELDQAIEDNREIGKELEIEKTSRQDDPAHSARARTLQKLLDRVGNQNRSLVTVT